MKDDFNKHNICILIFYRNIAFNQYIFYFIFSHLNKLLTSWKQKSVVMVATVAVAVVVANQKA
jgi:hypothetical protein